jgi:hypothetical protein
MRRYLATTMVMVIASGLLATTVLAQLSVNLNPSYAQRQVGGKVRMHVELTGATELLSMGVRVTFDPTLLTVESASKNDAVWVMDGGPGHQYTLPEAQIDNTGGTVTMIGGRLEGISGNVLLGWIVFQCNTTNTGQATIGLDLANPSPYDNFVREDGTVDDPPGFTGANICIVAADACEGDFNGDGSVTPLEFMRFRDAFNSSSGDANYDPACDFSAGGSVSPLDFMSFREDFNRTDCPSCP